MRATSLHSGNEVAAVLLGALVPVTQHEERLAFLHEHKLRATGLGPDLELEEARELGRLYADRGIVIGQVGLYRNLCATDAEVRRRHIEDVIQARKVAQALGARAVVTGAGHVRPGADEKVYAWHPGNWSDEARLRLAASCREVLRRGEGASLAVETWVMTPLHSPQAVQEFLALVPSQVGILFDFVNLMTPERLQGQLALLADSRARFGDRIRVAHLKDSTIVPDAFTFHMAEAVPGEGYVDFGALLSMLDTLDPDLPVLIEHISDLGTLSRAVEYVRREGEKAGVRFA